MTDIESLRAMLAKATKGPWAVSREDEAAVITGAGKFYWRPWGHLPQESVKGIRPVEEAALIVAAVNALPGLLNELAELRERRRKP